MLLAMSAKRLIRAGEGVCSAKRSNSAAFSRYSETLLMALAWEGRLCPQGAVAPLSREQELAVISGRRPRRLRRGPIRAGIGGSRVDQNELELDAVRSGISYSD